ncbi:MAG: MG2 domain-containing protein [Syntrophorhabdales bacterium]|jgi:uncharacterized protein YfaS (alpha-2-macroglobulin family)
MGRARCFLKGKKGLRRIGYGVVATLLLAASGWAGGSDVTPTVTMFSPQGEIRDVRQVTARFSEEMVSFGDPLLNDPFTIDCPTTGKGRWADNRNWVYDFDKDLKSGMKCTFTLKAGLKAASGSALTGVQAFSFNTGGPQVEDAVPGGGNKEIVEDQVFLLTLDGEAQEDSVAGNVFCYIGETKEKVGIRIVGGRQREEIVKAASRFDRGAQVDRIALQCGRPLPNNTSIDLIWGKGVLSGSAIPSSREQVFHYRTREPFTATFECGRESSKALCNPFLPVSIGFSSDVPRGLAARVSMKIDGKIHRPKIPDGSETVRTVTFEGPFREKKAFSIALPRGLRDDGGRSLSNGAAYPIKARTDTYPPLAKFSSRFGIIELSEPVLPVTVRNIGPYLRGRIQEVPDKNTGKSDATSPNRRYATDVTATIKPVEGDQQIIQWLQKVAGVGRSRSLLRGEPSAKRLAMPRPLGQNAFEVMGIPFKRPGLYVVELESTILGTSYLRKERPMYVHTAALVTNLSAHFKRGRESSLVWVTSLDKGEPVEGANVAIRDCRGKLYWEGKTDSNGIAHVNTALPEPKGLPYTERRADKDAFYDRSQIEPISGVDQGYFVFASMAGDATFVHTSWDKGIEPYRFRLPYGFYSYDEKEGPFRPVIHTIFDRPLFRAGETVHMKHVARMLTKDGFAFDDHLPSRVVIQHSGSHEKYTFPLSWDPAKGVAETTWQIPQDAKLGQYGVYVEKGERRYPAGEFKVQQFKVPLMKASVKPLSETLVNATKVDVDVMAEYLSGGGAKGLPIKLRAQAEPKEVTFEDYDQYSFSRGAVKEGIKRRGSESPSDYPDESIDEGEEATGWSQRYSRHGTPVKTLDLTLGEGGMARAAIDGIPRSSVPLDLFTEMEFKDPNGKVVTVSKTIPIWPSGVAIGLETDDWVVHKDPLKVKALALDLSGKPVANLPVTVTLFQKKIYSHRKKLLGGFYAYENSQEIKKSGTGCEGTTNAQGLLFCEIENPPAGSLLVEARAADGKGNVAATNTEVWVTGREEMWFDASSSDRIDLIPDKQRYEPGENALFQVRMPMREATALITVEREGIIDSFVTRLSGTNPSVEVPIKGSYSPNVFVSALCVRGRTGEGKPTAFLDLAKPTFKLGIAGVSVGWRSHELKVGVASDKKVYKIREKARFSVKVQTADGRPVPAGSEVAFAVVDDGLLELMQNESWNILEHMMQKRGYSVATSTAQMQVVGRRHYGLKAIPFGGGGGRQITRELFDTLLLWKGSLPLDEKGEATVEVPLNDALTSFTAVAVATGAADLFGTGRTHIQSTQDLMILSGLSDVVREGDQFKAVFTLRNTSDHEVATETKARVTHEKGVIDLLPLKESLKAGEAREIGWNLTVPVGAESMKWEVVVTDSEGTARDSLKVTQRARPALEVSVVQASVAQLDKTAQFTVARPKEALPLKGGIKLSLTPKLSESVNGIIDYMTSYPYVCLEQRLSKAVALGDKSAWQQIMKVLPGYMDNDGLLKYFPTMEKGDDILTSYFIAIGNEAGWETPPELLARVKEGLQKFLEGKTRRESPLSRPDNTIRKIAAIEALCRLEPGNARYLQTIDIQPSFWPTSAVLDWTNILKRADDIPGREGRLKEAEQIIRSRLNFQGTRMGFSTERNDYLWWLMVNGDVNAVRTILTFLDDPAWIEDMPRLVRGATGRQEKGRWWSTVANAWGRLALGKFSDSFEAAKVEGVTNARVGGQSQTLDWKAAPAGKTLLFSWPGGSERLSVDHEGPGKPWLFMQSLAAIPLKEPVSTGFKIKKTYTPVDEKVPGVWSVGDVVRVRLDLEAQTDMTWVVVDDPVPAGTTILGTGLGRDSAILTGGEKREGWAWPAYEERSFEAFKAYYWYVPKGKWSLEYTVRLNTSGRFLLPNSRVEALYAPEMFGEMPNHPFVVE